MCGLPRSGKSTWIAQNKGNAVVVNVDQLRELVYHQRFWAEGEPLMWSIHGIVLRMLLGQQLPIIVDEPYITPEMRAPYINMAKEYGYTVECVVINTPKEECLNRAKYMDDLQIQPVIERMAKEYVKPSIDEGFDSVTVIEGNKITSVDTKKDWGDYSPNWVPKSPSKELEERAFAYGNEFPGSKVFIFSQDSDELFKKYATKQEYDEDLASFQFVLLANGSKVCFRHLKTYADLARYGGYEMDCCLIDKASSYFDSVLEYLRKRTRSSKGYSAEFRII